MPWKILIIDADAATNELLTQVLTQNNYTATSAYSGTEGKLLLNQEQFDGILLDLVLPGVDGECLIEEIRKSKTVPIIVISGKSEMEARINALRLGADDFISKPFDCGEVISRVEAKLRRCYVYTPASRPVSVLTWKNCVLNTETSEIIVNGKFLRFTGLELRILETLMRFSDRIFTREELFETCWEQAYLGNENTLAVHINRIRHKIATADPNTKYIMTIHGVGFRLSR